MTIDIEKLLEKKEYNYHKETGDYHFIIVGAGGTGGYLIPNLARMVSLTNEQNEENRIGHRITIIDADQVEPKNLTRQQFVQPDVGKNKAEVMARRYGMSFGLTIGYVKKYIESTEDLIQLMASSNHTPVLIDAVDNNKTRLIMKEAMDEYGQSGEVIMISSGNEEYAGQVIFSYKGRTRAGSVEGSDGFRNRQTPSLFEVFPHAEIGLLPTELSCAEQAISAPQNIHVNMTAANIMFGFVNKLLNYRPINELAIFFDTNTQQTSVYRATKSGLKDLMSLTPNNGEALDYFSTDELWFREEECLAYAPLLSEVTAAEAKEVDVL